MLRFPEAALPRACLDFQVPHEFGGLRVTQDTPCFSGLSLNRAESLHG